MTGCRDLKLRMQRERERERERERGEFDTRTYMLVHGIYVERV